MDSFVTNLPFIIPGAVAGLAIAFAREAKKDAREELQRFKKWEFASIKKDVEQYEREKWNYIRREEFSGHIGGLLLKIAELRGEVRVLEAIVDERTGAKG